LSAPTKLSALDKRTRSCQGRHPDKWRDYSGLDHRTGDYFAISVRAAKFDKDAQLDMIGKPTDRTRWTASPADRERLLRGSNNTNHHPAAILQHPCSTRTPIPPSIRAGSGRSSATN